GGTFRADRYERRGCPRARRSEGVVRARGSGNPRRLGICYAGGYARRVHGRSELPGGTVRPQPPARLRLGRYGHGERRVGGNRDGAAIFAGDLLRLLEEGPREDDDR